jgi:hypothetical protein
MARRDNNNSIQRKVSRLQSTSHLAQFPRPQLRPVFQSSQADLKRLKADIRSLLPGNYNSHGPKGSIGILRRSRFDDVSVVFFSLHRSFPDKSRSIFHILTNKNRYKKAKQLRWK